MKKRGIIIAVIALILSIGIFVTYAFISTGGKQTLANSFTSGCLSITIDSESPSININGAFPVTDVEGLKGDSYSFTIKNTCNQDENYMINLESLNQSPNSLNPIYIKTALSSDTFDNIITKLNNEIETEHYVEGAYISHNLYDGTIKASETKTFNLKLWMDYDTTTEQGLNKTYQSRINVIASSKATPDNISEVLTKKKGKEVEGTITGSANSASYCTSTGNACEPNKAVSINDNKTTPTLEDTEKEQIVCTKLDNKKVVCSNPVNNSYCPAGATSCESILAKEKVNDEILTEVTGPSCEEGNTNCGGDVANMNQNGVYMAEDDDGISYIYRGTIDNNWFKFGQTTNGDDIWWRIIRINGNGTVRLIYAGEGYDFGTTGNGKNAIENVKYNEKYDDNTYVGYYYGEANQNTYETTHTNKTPSILATQIEKWFSEDTKLNSDYITYIDENTGFCNDRTLATSNHGNSKWLNTGHGTESTLYSIYDRFRNEDNTDWSLIQKPILKCEQKDKDLFTLKNSTQGNNKLTSPVGLITADEAIFAGGFGGHNNTGYWLYTGKYYWTITPSNMDDSEGSHVLTVRDSGSIGSDGFNLYGVRPVINLKSDLKLIGNGTKENPYRIDERDKLQEAGKIVLANNEVKGVVSSITGPSCNDSTKCGNEKNMNQNGVYESPDDDGTSYIFRGTVDNNWVKFGKNGSQDIWWRILRINGNGSIRLIYSGEGTTPEGNGKNAKDNIAYNTENNDSTYVGYYYGKAAQDTYEATHTNEHSSTIATETEKWFTGTNLDELAQLNHIDENAGFCNNRQISNQKGEWWNSEQDGERGTGQIVTAYKGFYETLQQKGSWRTDKQYPNLRCSSISENYENNTDYKRDYYTWKEHTERGNQALTQPVGLIMVDELLLAGSFGGQNNTDFWLYTGEYYWTISPSNMGVNGTAVMFRLNNNGNIGGQATNTNGIRPVINLKADTNLVLEGNGTPGTVDNPYIVK